MRAARSLVSGLPLYAALAVLLTAFLPRQACAQPSFADSAEQLVIAGQRAYQQHTGESLARSIQLFQLALEQLGRPEHRRRAGTVLNNIGLAYRELNRTDSALVYFAQALRVRREERDSTGMGTTLYNMGVILYDRGRADSALVYSREALEVKRALRDGPGETETLTFVGSVHHVLGRADSAWAYHSWALERARAANERRVQARALEGLGYVHEALGRTDSARIYLDKAHEIQVALDNRIGRIGTQVSKTTLAPGGYGALVELHQALDSARALPDRRREADVLGRIGAVHESSNRPDSALAYYARALAIQRDVNDPRGESTTLIRIAAYHGALHHTDSALAYYTRVLPIVRDVQDRRGEGVALANIGFLHHSIGTPRAMAKAVAYYDSAAAVVAEIGRFAGGDDPRLSLAESSVPLFESWAVAWLSRVRQVGERRAAYAALAASERGRAQALRDLMRRNATRSAQAMRAAPARGSDADLPAKGRALASSLARGRVPALAYLVTEGNLYAFLVLPGGGVEVFQTGVTPGRLDTLVAEVRRGLGVDSADSRPRSALRRASSSRAGESKDSKAWQAPAGRLAELLLPAPLRARLPPSGELVIVPAGPLFMLPFAVLPIPSAARADSLLGLRYAIRYAPSLQVLADLEALPSQPPSAGGALVVGNPATPRLLRLKRLKAAGREGKWVSRRMGTELLTGSSATEAAVRARLGTAPVVHLATHALAYASDARARESFIAFAPGDGQDGLLTVGEVLDGVPEMRAELVVLSACQTGLGDLKQAEGTVGLQRAFLARGARGVLVSLWSVHDGATALLMTSFYTNWLSGHSKAEALRIAQAEVAKKYPNPRYWAAFQMVGAR